MMPRFFPQMPKGVARQTRELILKSTYSDEEKRYVLEQLARIAEPDSSDEETNPKPEVNNGKQ